MDTKNEIIKELELQISPVDFFDLTVKDIEILNLFKNKPDDFFSTFEIKTGYKKEKLLRIKIIYMEMQCVNYIKRSV